MRFLQPMKLPQSEEIVKVFLFLTCDLLWTAPSGRRVRSATLRLCRWTSAGRACCDRGYFDLTRPADERDGFERLDRR